MHNTVLTHTVIEDKAQTVINDYVRTKEILTEKMNAHDEVIAKILNDHEQSVNEITEKLNVHDGATNYLMAENKEREKDIAKVKENLQASYDHLIDKIERLNTSLFIAQLAIYVVLFIIVVIAAMVFQDIYDRINNKPTDVTITTEVSDTTGYEFGIAQIGATGQPEIIYDKDTKVMYLVSENGNHTVILNSDGSPKLYSTEE